MKQKVNPEKSRRRAPDRALPLLNKPPLDVIKIVREEINHLCVPQFRLPGSTEVHTTITILSSIENPEMRTIDEQIAELLAKKQQLEMGRIMPLRSTVDLETLKF